MIPVQGILAESLDEVGFPADVSIEFDRRERAALEENEDALSIGDRRRIAAGTIAMFTSIDHSTEYTGFCRGSNCIRLAIVAIHQVRRLHATLEGK